MARPNPPIHTRFKKGQSGNPSGRPKMPEHLKGHHISDQEMRATFAKYVKMTKQEIFDAVQNPNTPVFELWIASGITKGIKIGDWTNLREVLDRLFGKPQASQPINDDNNFTFTLNYKE